MVNPEIKARLDKLLDSERMSEMRGALMMLNVVDIADYMDELDKGRMLKVYRILPKDISFDAFKQVFADSSMTYSMIFSVIVTLVFTLLGMIVCTCAAYPLSKKRLKGRGVLAFILMVPMYFRLRR